MRGEARPSSLTVEGSARPWSRILVVITEDWFALSHFIPLLSELKALAGALVVAARPSGRFGELHDLGIETRAFDMQRGSLRVGELRAVRDELAQLIDTERPDAIHAIAMQPMVMTSLALAKAAHRPAAVILHDQELTLAQFEPARYDDPKMRRAAAEQIEIRPDPALTGVQAVVKIETDGATLTARCDHPRGSAENPLSRAQIESKFRTYADGVLAPSAIAETIDAVADLESLGSVRKLMDMLRAAPRRAALAAARG